MFPNGPGLSLPGEGHIAILRNEDKPVVCPSQPYSQMKHALLSAYGGRWNEVYLAMYTSFIDDSGTDPKQPIAVASALLIPAKRLIALESEWATFIEKEGIAEFHTSVCVARNAKSQFANWDDIRVRRVLRRVQQMIFKYSATGFSVAIYKVMHDKKVPTEVRSVVGTNHYAYAVDGVISWIYRWASGHGVPMEYVFDNVDEKTQKVQRREIDRIMMNAEVACPRWFAGRYQFRRREDIPALQCADLFAWACYQKACEKITEKPMSAIAGECWNRFHEAKSKDWCKIWVAEPHTYQDLEKIKSNYSKPVISTAKTT